MTKKNLCYALIVVVSVLTLPGCWNTSSTHCASFQGKSAFAENKPWDLPVTILNGQEYSRQEHQHLEKLSKKIEAYPPENRVRFSAELGITALFANDTELAKRMLDYSIASMERISIAGELEKKVTSLSGSESDKIFKGEPYEKVMVYLYRGLLYLSEGDCENAQACFKNAAIQDSIAENSVDRANWFTVDILELQCKKLMNTSDIEEFTQYIKDKYSSSISRNELSKILSMGAPKMISLLSVGPGPIKITNNEKGQQGLTYEVIPSRINAVYVVNTKGTTPLIETDNVFVQASTRGHRKMDAVLQDKANAKSTIEGIGDAAAMVAPLVPGGMVLGLLKEASWSASDNIDSSADCRQIQSIGNRLYIHITDEDVSSRIKFLASSGSKTLAEKYVVFKSEQKLNTPYVMVGHVPY